MNICLLATRTSAASFAESLAGRLSVPLRILDTRIFSDGEMKTRSPVNVRGQSVYLLQSLSAEDGQSPHDKLFEILIAAGSARDAGAARVVLVAPYLCYSRQDRRTEPLGPVTTRYLAQAMEAGGIGHVVTMDVHNPSAFENAFRIPTSNLNAAGLFAAELGGLLGDIGAQTPLTVVAPDVGAIPRCGKFREILLANGRKGVELAYVIKKRDDSGVATEAVLGPLADRVTVIYDDMISTGETIAHAVRACRERGAGEIIVAATHGLLNADAVRKLSELPIKQLMMTNSILAPAMRSKPLSALVRVVDSTRLLADEIRRLEL